MAEEDQIKYFTIEQVKIHNGKDDSRVWFIYKDSIYDVTEYLDDHPGGGDLITEYAGKDATKAFDDFGHSSDAKKQLKKYKIGEIVEEQRKGKRKAEVRTVHPEKPETSDKAINTEITSWLLIREIQDLHRYQTRRIVERL